MPVLELTHLIRTLELSFIAITVIVPKRFPTVTPVSDKVVDTSPPFMLIMQAESPITIINVSAPYPLTDSGSIKLITFSESFALYK